MANLILLLFECDSAKVAAALDAGIRHFIVDWEWREKYDRQVSADTEINCQTVADLATVARTPGAQVWCRINRFGAWTRHEVDQAIDAGAQLLLLPMVETATQVGEFLDYVGGRCQAGILVETRAGFRDAKKLACFPLDAVYVGLNDLMISLGRKTIFDALAEGIVDSIRDCFDTPLFGFGGVTVVDGGAPLPCRVFLQEMARLRCNLSFLRRSFKRDMVGRDGRRELARIAGYWDELMARDTAAISRDHRQFLALAEQIARHHSAAEGVV